MSNSGNLVRRSVLIVDDDRLIRDTLARVLSSHHEVMTVESGAAALAALANGSFDVILCDVMMPDLSGRDLHQRIAVLHAGQEHRIVFMTGGTTAPEIDRFLQACGNQCLEKPFGIAQIEQLLAAVATRE